MGSKKVNLKTTPHILGVKPYNLHIKTVENELVILVNYIHKKRS